MNAKSDVGSEREEGNQIWAMQMFSWLVSSRCRVERETFEGKFRGLTTIINVA